MIPMTKWEIFISNVRGFIRQILCKHEWIPFEDGVGAWCKKCPRWKR